MAFIQRGNEEAHSVKCKGVITRGCSRFALIAGGTPAIPGATILVHQAPLQAAEVPQPKLPLNHLSRCGNAPAFRRSCPAQPRSHIFRLANGKGFLNTPAAHAETLSCPNRFEPFPD